MGLELTKYQRKGIAFWIAHPRTYYAVDMGLGKTAIVLHALCRLKQPALVVGPIRPIYTTWPEEIKKWGLPLTYTIVHGKDKLYNIQKKADVYLANFESIPFIYDYLVSLSKRRRPCPFSVLVIDEGSMIKAPNTQRLRYLEALRKVFPGYRAILSGTPSPNSLLDLLAQYYILTDGETLGEHYGTFRHTHYDADEYNAYTYTLKPGADQKIYDKVAPITFRLDEADHLDLPELVYNYIPVQISKTLRREYNKFKKEFLLDLENVTVEAVNAATLSSKLRQLLQGFIYYYTDEVLPNGAPKRFVRDLHTAKVDALKEVVETANSPVLCAIQFKHEIEMIRRAYPDVPVIAGGTDNTKANDIIAAWNRGEVPLLLCHPRSLSHGVNLQSGGSTVLWFCQTWSLEQYLQFNKRLHRRGQTDSVIIHHLVVQNTIDDRVTAVLSRKNITQKLLLDFLKEGNNYE